MLRRRQNKRSTLTKGFKWESINQFFDGEIKFPKQILYKHSPLTFVKGSIEKPTYEYGVAKLKK